MNNNMTKAQRDNRANQLNPNNIAYYKSRMPSTSQNKSNNNHKNNNNYNSRLNSNKSANKNIHNNKKTVKNITNVYHTHTESNVGYKCPICGRAGGLEVAAFGRMKCTHCGGRFDRYRIVK